MKRLAAIAVLALILSSCATLTDVFKTKSVEQRFNDAKVLIVAVNNTIAYDVENDFITPDEGEKRLAASDDVHKKLIKIDGLIKIGDLSSADAQLKALDSAMIHLREYLVKKSKEE